MKKSIGKVLSAAGLIGVVFYSYKYFEDSETFRLLGADVGVSTGDYVPILISGVVLLSGLLIVRSK